MTRRRRAPTMVLSVVLSCASMQIGCKAQEQPSSLIGDYAFSRDYAGERWVLRIEPSAEQPAECMLAPLPTTENAPWREATLRPELHRSLIRLMFDDGRVPHYEADTEASTAAEAFVCDELPNEKEVCYIPQVAVTGVGVPWRFGLQSDVTLSEQSQELIDAFLAAHDACWNSGTDR